MKRRTLECIVLVCLVAFPCRGQHAAEDSPVGQLSSGAYSRRAAAMYQIWRDQNPDQVREAIQSADPEVRLRARWIQSQWDLGITSGTPLPLARFLRGHVDENIDLQEIIRSDHLEGLIKSLAAPNSQSVRALIARKLGEQFPALTAVAIEEGKTDDFVRLLSKLSYDPTWAIRRARLMFQTGTPASQCLELPDSASEMSSYSRDWAEIMIRWHVGLREEAIEFASQRDSTTVLSLMVSNRSWEALVKHAREAADLISVEAPSEEINDEKTAKPYLTNCVHKAKMHATEMLGHQRLGNQQSMQQSLDAVLAIYENDGFQSAIKHYQYNEKQFDRIGSYVITTAEILVAVDRTDLAIDVLKGFRPIKASELLVDRLEYQKAFETLGTNPYQLTDSLFALATEATQTIPRTAGDDPFGRNPFAKNSQNALVFRRALAACRLAFHVGHEDAARHAMRQLMRDRSSEAQTRKIDVISMALRTSKELDFAIELATPLLDQASSDSMTAETLYGSNLGRELWPVLKQVHTDWSIAQRGRALISLSRGEVPEGWDKRKDFDSLGVALFNRMTGDGRRFGSATLRQAAELFQLFSIRPMARMFDEAARSHVKQTRGDYQSWMDLAEHHVVNDRHVEGVEIYEQIWRRFPEHPETLVPLSKALGLIGQEDRAKAVRESIDMLVLSPEQFYNIALQFSGTGETQSAIEFFNKVLDASPIDVRGSFHYRSLTQLIRLIEDNPTELADLQRRRMERLLGPISLTSMGPYATLACAYHVQAARAALQADEQDEARQHLKLAVEHSPGNIDFVENELLEMRNEGSESIANEMLDQIFAHTMKHLEQFPLSANISNNLAWVSALHNRHLDEALELSSMAVSLYPTTFSYRDTLAEVLFRRGENQQAIKVEANCLLDVPDDFHLHTQLDRFSSQDDSL